MKHRCLVSLALLALSASAQDLRSAVDAYVAAHKAQIFSELVELLSIPNVAADRENIRRNARHLRGMLERRGLAAEILETRGNPLVYGERTIAGARHTILFYIHYDGQPVDPSRWKQPGPFHPILRDGRMEEGAKEIPGLSGLRSFDDNWRIYARSASDDKSPIVAFCNALDALKAAGRAPASNIRVILDGEEEAGSPSLNAAIGRYREKLRADLCLILDGPLHPSGRPTLVFGARGVTTLELTVYGPKFALHSGHYGNWVPNPAMRLAQLLASMKDDQGRVLVEGFYEGIPPLDPEERRVLQAVPDNPAALQKLFGIARPDAVGESLQEAIQFPSLNVRGLRSGYVGAEARTIIPADATAALDLRLIPETPADRQVEKVLAHIRKQRYHIVDADPDDATRLSHPKLIRVTRRSGDDEAYRTGMNLPESLWVAQAVERMWGRPPVRLRTSGGTVPLAQFIRALGFPAISAPTVNFDNNQHSENENLRLGHFWNAIVTMAALLAASPPQAEASWVDPDKTEPAGTKYRTFRSATINADSSYLIYLPPDYQTAPSKRYPVVYWLHGLGGNQRGGAVFVSQLDAAIRAGKSPSMIAVLVNGLRDSRYYDSFDGKRPVESVIVKDLIPHIDQTYRTIARRETRAIEGYSMGGFGAARLGFRYPGLFGLVSIMAGALLDTESVATTMHAELFEKNFGANKAYFHAGSPWVLAPQNASQIRGRTYVRIGVGSLDDLYERNLTYHEMLERLGITNEFFAVPGVPHNGRLFYEKLGASAIAFYQKALGI